MIYTPTEQLNRLSLHPFRPDLFDRLLEAMQQAFQSIESGHPQARLVLHRALLNFQQAVKALSENRTMAGKNIMGRVSTLHLQIASPLY